MRWTKTDKGFVASEEGYIIEGQPEGELKMKLFAPGDMQQPIITGNELAHLQLIAQGHHLASRTVKLENCDPVAAASARQFLFTYSNDNKG